MKDLAEGKATDESQIEIMCQFVDARYDCADFRTVLLVKTIYAYEQHISENMRLRIKECLLTFKYWMDEPGDDSMCFWSENHQILFHTCEYLAGQLYEEEVFSNSLMTGKDHVEKAEKKLLQWLKHRWQYGFIEWHSNTYYEEDVAALTLLVEYAGNKEISLKAAMILDLLLLDLAMYSFDGYFSSSSGRCYEKQKKDGDLQNTRSIYLSAFNESLTDQRCEGISGIFAFREKYVVPEVIRKIATDKNPGIIKDSMGLNLAEVKKEMGTKDMESTGAYLWQMEAFINMESVEMTMKMFNHFHMANNMFLHELNMINHKILLQLRVLPLLMKVLNPSTQGVAIQRSNNYTYKTDHFMQATAMRYHPGEFGDQQHIWHAALPNNIQIFGTHPGAAFFDDHARNESPGYWVGNGILPDAAQHENIQMSLYKTNVRKGYLERKRYHFSHVYFPVHRFDEVVRSPCRVFGKTGDTYVSIAGTEALRIENDDEIIQEGKLTGWVCEVSSRDASGSFEDFIRSAEKEPIVMNRETLLYKNLSLTYKGDFKAADRIQTTAYQRLETPYGFASRKPENIDIAFEGHSLHLDFEKLIRNISAL